MCGDQGATYLSIVSWTALNGNDAMWTERKQVPIDYGVSRLESSHYFQSVFSWRGHLKVNNPLCILCVEKAYLPPQRTHSTPMRHITWYWCTHIGALPRRVF